MTRRFGDTLELRTRVPQRALGDQPITAEATIRNISGQNLESVALVRNISEAFQEIETTIQGKPAQPKRSTEDMRYYDLGVLPAGESRTVKVRGRPAEDAQELDVLFGVEYPMTARLKVPVHRAKLEASVSAIAGQDRDGMFYPCDDVRLHYEIKNSGQVDIAKLTVTEELPKGVLTQAGKEQIQFETGPLAAGETFRKDVSIEAKEVVAFRPRAVVKSEFGEFQAESERIRFSQPSLEASIDGPSEHRLGEPLEYAIRVRNRSDAPALASKVTLDMPEGIDIVNVKGDDVKLQESTFELGKIGPNEEKAFRIELKTKKADMLSLKAEADAYCAVEKVSDEIQTKLQGVPAVHLDVSDENDPVRVGETTSYSLTLRNEGTQSLDNVRLRVDLPWQFEFISAEGATKVRLNEGLIDVGELPTIEPEKELTWRFKVKAVRSGQAFLDVRMRAPAFGRILIVQEPTTVY